MAQTKQSIRNEWIRNNMKRYSVAFHNVNDSLLIEYIERQRKHGKSTNEIFRAGIEKLTENENGQ